MIKLQKYVDLAFRNPEGIKLWKKLDLDELKGLPGIEDDLDVERAVGVLIFELGFFPQHDRADRIKKAQQALARERGLVGTTVWGNTIGLFTIIDSWLDSVVSK